MNGRLRIAAYALLLAGLAVAAHADTLETLDSEVPVLSRPTADGAESLDSRIPVIRTIAMPADTNPAGTVFGGWLMAQMDLAAGSVATRVARGRVATVAVETMNFIKPVQVGDEVSFYADLLRVGTSSISIQVEGWRRQREGGEREMVTEAIFHFVALDENGAPRPVRPADTETR